MNRLLQWLAPFFGATVAALVLAGAASAQTFTWSDQTTDWGTSTAWNPVGGPPNATNNIAVFANQATINNQPTIGASNFTVQRVSFDNTGADWNLSGTTGVLSLSNTGNTASTAAIDFTSIGTSTVSANINLASSQFWFIEGTNNVTFSGTISGASTSTLQLRATSTSVVAFTGNNTYTGNTTLSSSPSGTSTYQIGSDQAFGIGGSISVNAGSAAVQNFQSINGDHTISNNFTIISFNVIGSQSLTFSGALSRTTASSTNITSNTTGGAAAKFTGTVNLHPAGDANNLTLTLNGSGRTEISGTILDTGAGGTGNTSLVINGAPATFVARLSGPNVYTGNTQVLGGTLLIGANSPTGAAGPLGAAIGANDTVSLGAASGANNATLLIDGPFGVGHGINVRSGNTGTMTLGGSTADASTFAGGISIGTPGDANNKTLNITAAAGGTVTFAGQIKPFGPTYTGLSSIAKIGPGTAILAAGPTHTYTGTTAVNAGTLIVNSTLDNSGGAVTVASAATLGGSGTINRAITVNGGGTFTPGDGIATPGTLTTGTATTAAANVTLDAANGGARFRILGSNIAGNSALDLGGTTNGQLLLINLDGINKLHFDLLATGDLGSQTLTWTIVQNAASIQRNGVPLSDGPLSTADYDVNAVNFALQDIPIVSVVGSGTALTLTFTPIPEPGTVLMASAVGLGAIGFVRRTRRRSV